MAARSSPPREILITQMTISQSEYTLHKGQEVRIRMSRESHLKVLKFWRVVDREGTGQQLQSLGVRCNNANSDLGGTDKRFLFILAELSRRLHNTLQFK